MYRVPIEMTREHAVKVGINPNEITRIYIEGKLTEVYYIEVESREVYLAIMEPIWKAEKEYQRNRRCLVSNGKGKLVRCKKDCNKCMQTRSGSTISLDAVDENRIAKKENGVHIQGGELTISEIVDTPEKIVMNAALREAIINAISSLSEEDQKIIHLFEEGLSERSIATQIGLSQKGVNDRKKAIFSEIKERIKDYI